MDEKAETRREPTREKESDRKENPLLLNRELDSSGDSKNRKGHQFLRRQFSTAEKNNNKKTGGREKLNTNQT